MTAALLRMVDRRISRYLLVSAGALAVDVGAFLALLSLGTWAAGASAVAYALGIAAHWLMSSRAVFADNLADKGAARSRQKILFTASAFVGLCVTTGIVWAGDASGFDPRAAKLAAIAVNFAVNWLLLSRIVFR